VWTVAEKILVPGEELPTGWPVAGTTGYDRRALIDGLFLDPAGEGPLTEGYRALTGGPADPAAVVAESRAFAVRQLLAADVARLTALLVEICEGRRHQRDRTRHELHEAVRALAAAFPVYRTYVRAEAGLVRREDEARVAEAVAALGDEVEPDLAAFLADLLLLRLPDRRPLEDEWVMQFQQLTGPATAKGVEDTAFYRFTRLLAQNEVGGDLTRFGVDPGEFHRVNAAVQDQWPATMTALSTHDTKRSADVRARLALLSECPAAWAEACGRWMAATARLWPGGEPDRLAQHVLFQTLVGAWPLPVDRAREYLAKATREAKLATSWTEPDEGYEAARDAYVTAVCAETALGDDITAFVADLVGPGRTTALAQTLLALTVPGVPDTYQGGELWDLSLVDPDNRRPVDFHRRRALLADLATGVTPEEVLARADEGLPKLAVIRAALALRARRPDAFGPGEAGAYVPLAAAGPAAAHAVAFVRGGEVAVVVPRLVLGLADRGGWADTTVALPPGRWVDVLSAAEAKAGPVPVADLLARFPVALLERAS
jgi:(1->4)-alpha-D-glucan 1-alpha-D-glucosylmutase